MAKRKVPPSSLKGDEIDSTVENKAAYIKRLKRTLKRVKYGYHLNHEDVSTIRSALRCQWALIDWEREIQEKREAEAMVQAEEEEETE